MQYEDLVKIAKATFPMVQRKDHLHWPEKYVHATNRPDPDHEPNSRCPKLLKANPNRTGQNPMGVHSLVKLLHFELPALPHLGSTLGWPVRASTEVERLGLRWSEGHIVPAFMLTRSLAPKAMFSR